MNAIFGRIKASRRKTDSQHNRPQSRVEEADPFKDLLCCAVDGSLLVDRCEQLVLGCLTRADAILDESARLAEEVGK